MLGAIFHYGLYSLFAYDNVESAKKRKTQNGSEWYYLRLIETGKFNPVSGFKETQVHHKVKYGKKNYFDFTKDFNKSINKEKMDENLQKSRGEICYFNNQTS